MCDEKSIDWNEELPALINPTIKNFRLCYEKSDIVKGIIEDLVIKSISGWVIESDDEETKKYIEEEAKRLDEQGQLDNFINFVNTNRK